MKALKHNRACLQAAGFFRARLWLLAGLLPALLPWVLPAPAFAWGQEGHSIIAEIAQRRLGPQAAASVGQALGRGVSLASVASWADDVREARPGTANWHFVNIPLAADSYESARDCASSPRGDCIVAELQRLQTELCATSIEARRDALRFAVHLVGDLHQPLHAVGEGRGGNTVAVSVQWRGLTCTGKCVPKRTDTNLHMVWDNLLINGAVWDWGAYVDRLEGGWLASAEAQRADALAGGPAAWAEQSHAVARQVWEMTPANHALDDAYFQNALALADRQLGLGGLRLARFLDDAYAAPACAAR